MTISADKIADLRAKKLEMIQAIIARLANYGATLKNYCITLTTAVCGFAITLRQPRIALLALLPIVLFAVLDSQFLRTERRFRHMFNSQSREDWSIAPDFSIDARAAPPVKYIDVVCSWAIITFYVPLAVVVILVVLISEHAHGHVF